jgi:4-hydroxybenzoate polyprenyltransferase
MKQWIKNAFIFFPLIFSGKFFELNAFVNCLITFTGFCFVASGLYVFNDLRDIEKDRHHPKKAKRPLATQEFSRPLVYCLITILIIFGLFLCSQISIAVVYTVFTYIIVHIIYNFFTKQIVLLDVVFVAAGFQIRIWAGAVAAEIFPSVWLQLCVFLLALFLGFTKRRHELASLKDKAPEHRSVLSHYTAYLLDQIIIICSTLAIAFYGLYTISSDITSRTGNSNMVYSVVFVIYGIFRYLYLVHVRKLGDDPGETLLKDGPLLINVLLWILFIGILLYSV